MRITLCASLALAALGCQTNLDGGGNEGGGGGAGATGGGPAGSTVATTTSTGGGATTGSVTSSSSGGGVGSCPPIEDLPEAQLLRASEHWITALGVTDTEILVGTEELADFEATFVRLAKAGANVLEERTIDNGITSFLVHDGLLLGGGYCLDGGTPYVIGSGPTFDAIVDGCPQNPTFSLAAASGGVAYDVDNLVEWASLDGDEPPTQLADFLPVASNEATPMVRRVVADATDVFALVSRLEFSPDVAWGEIWRIPLDEGLPTRLVETEHLAAVGSYFAGGIDSIVLDGEHVYFAEFAAGRVARVPKGGGPVEVLWEGENQVRHLVAVGDDLAFVDMSDPELGSPSCVPVIRVMPTGGGDAVATSRLPRYVGHLVTDGTSLFVAGQSPLGEGMYETGIFTAAATRP